MTTGQIVLLVVIFFIGIVVFTIIDTAKRRKKVKQKIAEIDDFEEADSYLSNSGDDYIAYDDNRKKICLLNSMREPIVINYSMIREIELIVDGEIISKKSLSSMAGRAVVGGVLGGGIGAVIGGATGKSKQKEKIKKIDLKISVDDLKSPFYKINFLSVECKKGSTIYNDAFEEAEKWEGILETILKRESEKEEIKVEN